MEKTPEKEESSSSSEEDNQAFMFCNMQSLDDKVKKQKSQNNTQNQHTRKLNKQLQKSKLVLEKKVNQGIKVLLLPNLKLT